MKILLSAAPWAYGNGPIGQCLNVAHEAKKRGHICSFIASPQKKSIIEAEGFEVIAVMDSDNQGVYPDKMPIFFSDFLKAGGLSRKNFVFDIIQQEMEAISQYKPDVIFSVWHVTLHITAQVFNIPVFTTTYFPDHPTFVSPLYPKKMQKKGKVESVLNAAIKSFHLEEIHFASDLIYRKPIIPVCPFPLGFDMHLEKAEPTVKIVGSIMHDYNRHNKTMSMTPPSNACLVYTPDDTTLNWLFSERVSRLLSSKITPILSPLINRSVPNPWKICDDIPFEAALQQVQFLISHGGCGSTFTALENSCPVIMIPGKDPEREYVGSCIEKLGLGVVIRSLSPQRLSEAIEKVLSNEMVVRIKQFSSRLSKENGALNIVQLLEGI